MVGGPPRRRWRRLLEDLGQGALDFVWPQACPVCGRWTETARSADPKEQLPAAPLHRQCLREMPRSNAPAAQPRPFRAGAPVCWGFQDSPTFFRVLHLAKYGGKPGFLRVLGTELARIASRRGWVRADHVLVPLPDDPQRQRQRGYSVTGILARVVAAESGAAIRGDLLVRRRLPRRPQATIELRRERQANVRGLFGVGRLCEIPPGRPLILVEDQVTTGATMSEALRLLGARGHPILGLALGGAKDAPGRLDRP